MDDQKIIELYNARNHEAIEATAGKYGNYCLCIAENILFDRMDAEECVNDTWLKAWNAIPPQQPQHLKLFLAKITRNLSLNRYKQRTRDKRGGGEAAVALDEIGGCLSGTADTDDAIDERELVRSINRFLRTLPERERHLFIKRYFHFDPTAKLAAAFGLTEGNVRKILSRTRAKLKLYLEREGYAL